MYEVLQECGIEVVVANARDARSVPGRKSDVNDAQWLQRLHACGLLRGSFRPERNIAEHVESPHFLFKEVARVLQPAGFAVLTTLNARSALRYLQGRKWYGTSDPSHLYLFRKDSFAFTLERAGLTVTRLRTQSPILPLAVSNALSPAGIGGQIFCIATRPVSVEGR